MTASRFGEICRATEKKDVFKLCSSLYNKKKITTEPIIYGQQNEAVAVRRFEESFEKQVERCGLFVCEELPFLAASPDGLVIGENAIIEVKCPYNGRLDKIEANKNFPYLDVGSNGQFYLKQTHPYFYQIQGQLYICKKSYCYFIIYTKNDIFIQKIDLYPNFCMDSLLPKLKLFYKNSYRPFLAKIFNEKYS